jgi:hypothetical protein
MESYVLLPCYVTANGNKLPPYVILNRKTVQKEHFCKGVMVWTPKKNAWMTSELMEAGLECVWEQPGALSNPWSMLVMDTFCGCLSDRIINRLRNENTDLVMIPSSRTSQLQPFGVSVNKPFKNLIHKRYDAWLNKDSHILTPSGKVKRAAASIIMQ